MLKWSRLKSAPSQLEHGHDEDPQQSRAGVPDEEARSTRAPISATRREGDRAAENHSTTAVNCEHQQRQGHKGHGSQLVGVLVALFPGSLLCSILLEGSSAVTDAASIAAITGDCLLGGDQLVEFAALG
ncbi:hypothetical protein PR202_gb03836 [Eleusine coracana subsp. coracana]|uniref:Uncharacterized protein n=1 Tax=Eleusine coracana subsp. coracana TaxID=191504 RepID=A0AAV5E0I5_ELECO|nr:hypothetical protein PR202_gb03836 [Eleusine coracana subsp. coracana]